MAAATATALLVGATGGLAAPGGGATIVPTFCSIQLAGIGTAEGPGQIILLPNGGQVTKCNAELLATATAPAKVVRFESGGCTTVVLPTGQVNSTCRP